MSRKRRTAKEESFAIELGLNGFDLEEFDRFLRSDDPDWRTENGKFNHDELRQLRASAVIAYKRNQIDVVWLTVRLMWTSMKYVELQRFARPLYRKDKKKSKQLADARIVSATKRAKITDDSYAQATTRRRSAYKLRQRIPQKVLAEELGVSIRAVGYHEKKKKNRS